MIATTVVVAVIATVRTLALALALLQLDTKINIGNIVTIIVIIFGAGAILQQFREMQKRLDQSQKDSEKGREKTDAKLESLSDSIERVRAEYLSKSEDLLKEQRSTDKVDELTRRIMGLEGEHREMLKDTIRSLKEAK